MCVCVRVCQYAAREVSHPKPIYLHAIVWHNINFPFVHQCEFIKSSTKYTYNANLIGRYLLFCRKANFECQFSSLRGQATVKVLYYNILYYIILCVLTSTSNRSIIYTIWKTYLLSFRNMVCIIP